MRMSMRDGDPAFERTQWIRSSGARITVWLNMTLVDGVFMADEAEGIVGRHVDFGNGGTAIQFLQGRVEIKISLRD